MVDSYFNYTNTLQSASAYLSKIQADFQTKYRYTVLGQDDELFTKIGGSATGGDNNFIGFKNFRTSELISIAGIDRSTADSDTKLKQTAVTKLNFTNNALATLGNVISSTGSGSGNSEEIATALGALTDHLQEAVDSYADAVANGKIDPSRDAGFVTAAKTARFTIIQQSLKVKPLLISDNKVFNTDMYNLNTKLNDILNKLNTILSTSKAATAAASTSSSSTADAASSTSSSAATDTGGVDVTV